jgi:hypothetical protein
MAETLGSLCDKLTIVKLKQWHTEDGDRLVSLGAQEAQLRDEIDSFVAAAVSGALAPERLTFAANKVYKSQGNELQPVPGDIGGIFAELAKVNCDLWHEQEKVYDFEAVPAAQKDAVVQALARLNLRRNQCIDAIDRAFCDLVVRDNSSGNAGSR